MKRGGPSQARLSLVSLFRLEDPYQEGDDEQYAHDRPDDSASSQDSLLLRIDAFYPRLIAAKRKLGG